MDPFNKSVSTLVKKKYTEEIKRLYDLDDSPHQMHHKPQSEVEALSVVMRYLKGTADWYREQVEKEILRTQQFKNFRTKKAKDLSPDFS